MAARNMIPSSSTSTRNLLLSSLFQRRQQQHHHHHRFLSSSNPPNWPPVSASCLPKNMWAVDIGRWAFRISNSKLEGVSEKQFYNFLVKAVGNSIGSEAEARKRIYFVSTGLDGLGFGAYVDKQNKDKIREGVEGVVNSFPDVFYEVRENDPKTRPLSQ